MTSIQRHILDTALRHFAATGERSISVSDLSRAAQIARGTIYNNFDDPSQLFELVADMISEQFEEQAEALIATTEEPRIALVLLLGLFLRHAHEQPERGRFLVHFAPSVARLRNVWADLPLQILRKTITNEGLTLANDDALSYLQLLAGSTYSFMFLVVEGQKSWREAFHTLSGLVLAAGRVPAAEAQHDVRAALDILIATPVSF